MKTKIVIILVLILGISQIKSSLISSNKKIDFNCEKILSNMVYFKSFKLENYVVRVVIYTNPSGSANIPESDEVSSNIIVMKNEYGENEPTQFFKFDNIYNPKVVSVKENKVDITFAFNKKRSLILK